LPEIVLAGRSNVGKSSLINCLLERKNLARTSSQPGKTQTLNYYRINNAFYFVDLPGYGYAKVSKAQRKQWGQMIEDYLLNRKEMKLLLHVVDMRHPPTKDDCLMREWLEYYRIPARIVATKADKIPRGKWSSHLNVIRKAFHCEQEEPIVPFSSVERTGKEELWAVIEQVLP
jgi:GTP-binding protein